VIFDIENISIYLRPGKTDMRKQINGLSALVETEMSKDPFSGALFLFCNRSRKLLKAVYWDKNGFCMWQKRLEKHRFPWPQSEDAVRNITAEELKMLLQGIDFFHAHSELKYKNVV
jgi:transposase